MHQLSMSHIGFIIRDANHQVGCPHEQTAQASRSGLDVAPLTIHCAACISYPISLVEMFGLERARRIAAKPYASIATTTATKNAQSAASTVSLTTIALMSAMLFAGPSTVPFASASAKRER